MVGRVVDPESGLVYLRARYYDPTTGQFLNRDPMDTATRSAYGYMADDPLSGTDPLGLCPPVIGCHQGIADFAGGVLNVITLGHEHAVTSALGVADHVNRCSGAYVAGEATAAVAAVLVPGGEAADAVEGSPVLNPADFAGKTPAEVDQLARDSGLMPTGPDPMNGAGSYTDPVTGEQRVLSHPNDPAGGHIHVNDPTGQRLDINGNPVSPNSPDAHLPIGLL